MESLTIKERQSAMMLSSLKKFLQFPFCRTRGRYTGTVQSVLFKSMVVPNWDIIMTICSIHFRSLRRI
jgi:3-hydroxymyristoyl/3-hydroxydecanoyl-(acyl carrier protein) dehydratase